MQTISNAP